MAKESEFAVKGLAELERQLLALGDTMTAVKMLRGSLSNAMLPMRKEAQRLAPVADKTIVRKGGDVTIEPGTLQKAIRVRTFRGGEGPEDGRHTAASAYLYFTRKGYWGNILEFGGSNVRAYPMLRPAFDLAAPEAVERLRKSLARRIKRQMKKQAQGK